MNEITLSKKEKDDTETGCVTVYLAPEQMRELQDSYGEFLKLANFISWQKYLRGCLLFGMRNSTK